MIMNENEKILFSDDDNDTTLTFDEIGTISFDDILRPDRITLADDSDNINKGEEPDEIILENEGELLLDGTDSSQTDAGFKLLQNTPETVVTAQDGGVILLDGTDSTGSDAGLRIILEGTTDDLGFPTPIRLERDVRTVTSSSEYATFILEESGTLISESNSSESVTDRLLMDSPTESAEITLEDIFSTTVNDKIKLEYGEGNIILDSAGNSTTTNLAGATIPDFDLDEGDFLTFETETRDTTKLALETFNIFPAEGQIPKENFRLSSRNDTAYKTKYGYTPVVVPAEVTVRSTGDIALEDATDDTHGFLVLDTAAHAGDNIDLEGATGITF